MTNPHILNREKLKEFPPKSGTRQDVHSCHFYSTVLELLVTAIREEKEIKGIQIAKEEVKLSLLVHDMILLLWSSPGWI